MKKPNHKSCFTHFLLSILMCCCPAWAGIALLDSGNSKAVIVAPSRVMGPDIPFPPAQGESPNAVAELQRRTVRESVNDLSHYLEKITGVPVEIVTDTAPQGKGMPIYIGELAEKVFGPVGKDAPFKQGFRYVVNAKGVGLYGESDLASSYAIYEMLDRLGCRWYMPSELGEVIPQMKAITLDDIDFSSAPGTLFRNIWYGDDAYKRRNRLGGMALITNQGMEGYVTKADRKNHPDWCAEIGGKPSATRLKWSNAEVATAIADTINASLDKNPRPSVSLSPADGASFDESPEDKKLDTGDWDTTMNTVSLTDRLMVLYNRIVPQVLAKHPDTLFGMLAYVQFTRPPVREKVDPHVVPEVAPITYDRAHPITDGSAPHNTDLLTIVEGWGKAANRVSYYPFGYYLAEVTAPYPLIGKWSVDLPIFYKNHCAFWKPETLPSFETTLHGTYLGERLAWDPTQDPAAIIKELNDRFYGHAAPEMTAYWKYVDDVWTQTPEYSGGDNGYLKRFTRDVMAKMRSLMDAGAAACKTSAESQRVEIANASLRQFELYMKMRQDFAAGRFDTLAADSARWRDNEFTLGNKYKAQYTFELRSGKYSQAVNWYDLLRGRGYLDAARVQQEDQILTSPLKFKYIVDRKDTGEQSGWSKEAFDDSAWAKTDPAVDTWSMLGLYDYMGTVWYRSSFDLASLPQGKKVFLWLGGTDGSAEPYVNGKPITYSDPKTGAPKVFSGYATPVSFDITGAVRNGSNEIAIRCKRPVVNEIGTGGLLGPVLVYAEK